MEVKVSGGSFNGCAFGENNTVNNNLGTEEREIRTFIEEGKKACVKYEPTSEEYMILNSAIVYAERNDRYKFIETLKKYSLDIWEKIFTGVASKVVIELIKKWSV